MFLRTSHLQDALTHYEKQHTFTNEEDKLSHIAKHRIFIRTTIEGELKLNYPRIYSLYILTNRGFYFFANSEVEFANAKLITSDKEQLRRIKSIFSNKHPERPFGVDPDELSKIFQITGSQSEITFADEIRVFYNDLADNAVDRELSKCEFYDFLLHYFDHPRNTLDDGNLKFRSDLFFKMTRLSIHIIEKIQLFEVLHDYNLFNSETYDRFYHHFFSNDDIEQLKYLLYFLYKNKLLNEINFAKFYKHKSSDILLKYRFFCRFEHVLNQVIFDIIVTHHDLPTLQRVAAEYHNFDHDTIRLLFQTQHLDEIYNLCRNYQIKTSEEVKDLLSILLTSKDNLDALVSITHAITLNSESFRKLLKKNHYQEILLLLAELSPSQINKYSNWILDHDDYTALKKLASLETSYRIDLTIKILTLNEHDTINIVSIIELAFTSGLSSELISLLALAYTDIDQFNSMFIDRVMNFNSNIRFDAITLLEFIDKHKLFENSLLIQWVENNKNLSILKMIRQFYLVSTKNSGGAIESIFLRCLFHYLNQLNITFQHFPLFLQVAEQWSLNNELTLDIVNFLILAYTNTQFFVYKLTQKMMNQNEEDRCLGLKIFTLFNNNQPFIDDPLFKWIECNMANLSAEMHKLLAHKFILNIKGEEKSSDLSILAQQQIQSKYPDLKNYIYPRHCLDEIKQLCCLILSFPKSLMLKHIASFSEERLFLADEININIYKMKIYSRISNNQSFIEKYNQLIQVSPEQYHMTFDNLYQQFQISFDILCVFFPLHYEKILFQQLSTSVIPLHHFLNSLMTISHSRLSYLALYLIGKLDSIHVTTANHIATILDYLSIIFSDNFNHDELKYIYSELLLLYGNYNLTDKVYLDKLHMLIQNSFFKEIGLPSDLNNQDFIYSNKQLCQLRFAKENNRHNDYIPIFITLVKRHCLGESISTFLHDVGQMDPEGKMIAEHNIVTQKMLSKAGINIATLLNYPYQHSFYVCGQKLNAYYETVIATWKLIINLLESLLFFKHSQSNNNIELLNVVIKKIENLTNQINKKVLGKQVTIFDVELIQFISNSQNMSLMNTVSSVLSHLLQSLETHELSKLPTWSSISQTATDLINKINQLKLLIDESINTNHAAWRKPRRFTVKVWDKTDARTFFLGDELGCCLATTGNEFPSIIQRIIDDGMAMVMVIDDQINEAVAGMWLYCAEEVNTSTAYLVANFTEMRAAIAKIDSLRNAIIIEMLKFTNGFAQAINAKFVMSSLEYGSLPNWQFSPTAHQFRKIGLMSLRNHSEYYLNSIRQVSFYHYNFDTINSKHATSNETIVKPYTNSLTLPSVTTVHPVGLLLKQSMFMQSQCKSSVTTGISGDIKINMKLV
jgi:hypothetical protein